MIINIGANIKSIFKELSIGCIQADVEVVKFDQDLWGLIEEVIKEKEKFRLEDIKNIPLIESYRKAYKKLGKDPSRYRLAAEALHRRLVKGLGLYQISNVVDIINLVALKSGYSIGGFDADLIQGTINLDIGRKKDIYEAIGRGIMNIENFPVLRDDKGAFGNPTSDSVRTMITEKTKNILFTFLDFGTNDLLEQSLTETKELLAKFANSNKVQISIVQ